MLKAGNFRVILLAAALAGCTSGPRLNTERVPDWVSEDVTSAPVQRTSTPPLPPPPLALSLAPTTQSPTSNLNLNLNLNPKPNLDPPVSIPEDNQTWVPFARWCKANGLPQPAMLSPGPPPWYELNTTSGAFVLHVGSRVVTWDRMQLNFGFAPQLINGQMFVHYLDLKKTLRPVLTSLPRLIATNRTIVIDPGHGGENAGTRSAVAIRYEKEFTLDWGRRLASLLSSNGWQVFLTRTSDVDLALSNRTAIAESHKADLFISLHFNSAAPDEAEAGLETYCLTPSGMPSTVTRGFPDDASLVFPNNVFDQQNLQLAASVHRALLQVNGDRDRGVRRARFLGVLRNQRRPAILIEGGYLSNPREARMISDPAYRQKLAEAVAQGLINATGIHLESISVSSTPSSGNPQELKSQRTEAKPPPAAP